MFYQRKWYILTAIALSMAGLYFLFPRPSGKTTAKTKTAGNSVIEKKIRQFDRSVMESKGNKIDSIQKLAKVTLSANEKNLAEQFIRMAQLRGSLNKKALRREVLERLAKDPDNLEISKHILQDIDWTLKAFPKDQAELRIFSIALLKARADLGDIEPIQDQIGNIVKQMKASEEAWKKGRAHDLADLLAAWIELKGKDGILDDPEALFKKFHYHPKFKYIFAHAYEYAGMDLSDNPSIRSRIAHFWSQTFD